jgi:hypothetical protein
MKLMPISTLAHADAGGAFEAFWEAGPAAAMFTVLSIVMIVATLRANRIQHERLMFERATRESAGPTDTADSSRS